MVNKLRRWWYMRSESLKVQLALAITWMGFVFFVYLIADWVIG
tara:strand:+ start:128 stop:256 length:129 start_codon:yes stop_codon:yes gene_type:complete